MNEGKKTEKTADRAPTATEAAAAPVVEDFWKKLAREALADMTMEGKK